MVWIFLFISNVAWALFLLSWKRQVMEMTKQVKEKKKLRVSLFEKHLEKLAGAINEKSDLEQREKIRLIQEKERLKQSIANISHDLRTPLTSIQGYFILFHSCEDEKERESYLSTIQAKADYLAELVQVFYDLSLIENEDYRLEIEKLDINRIVTDCALEKYNELNAYSTVIKTQNAPVWISGNAIACKRIIENLITNAIRHSDGDIEISIGADGVFTIKNKTLELENIDPRRLLQKFYTVDESRSNGNTGLGLYIVSELLRKIGGSVEEISLREHVLTVSVSFAVWA